MNSDAFRSISLNGRVCFGISCLENVLINLNQDTQKWHGILRCMWSFTSIDSLDDWADMIVEILPECLLEYSSYSDYEFKWVTEEEFEELYKMYIELDPRINELLDMIYSLGSSHAYSKIIGHGKESLNVLNRILGFMKINNFTLPDVTKFQQYSIEENAGWGNEFDGTTLSRILNP